MLMKNLVFILCLLYFFSACTTVQSISFERLHAADVNFPDQVRTVGVVNCISPNKQAKGSEERPSASLELDGMVTAERLAQEIAATDYFNHVVICDSVVFPLDVNEMDVLPGYLKDSLIQVLGVDMLMSVERLQIKLQESTMFFPELGMQVPSIDGVIAPVFRTYIAGRETPLFTIAKTDTICWDLSPTLTPEQIAKDASEYAAILPMEYLLPYWKEVDRYYFDGGSVDMRDAGVFVREQNWEQASMLWKNVYDTKKGKTKMRAAFNLALFHEMQDEFEEAKTYLRAASELVPETSWEQQLIQFYQLQLDDLAQDNNRLKIQMKRFEDK